MHLVRVCIYTTVKPPKKVHIGDETFVPCREVVPFSEVLPYTVEPPNKGHFGNGSFVLSSEVVPISEVHHVLIINVV